MAEAILEIGTPAPEFKLTALNGASIDLAKYRGAPLLVYFFNSTCPWCQVEMPRLGDIYRRHPAISVQFLGIVVGDDDNASAEKFAHDINLTIPIAVDTDKSVREAYRLLRIPTVMLIDANGNIARVYEGATEQLAGIVEQTLLSAAGGERLPDYHLVGNGCEP